MADRTIEELEQQLDAIAVCIRSEELQPFLRGAWPDLSDILSEAATQLRRLRKMFEEDAPGGPTRLDVDRILASMLSVIHTWHGDVAWEIYRDSAPELADYRAFVGDADPPGSPDVPPPKQKRYA